MSSLALTALALVAVIEFTSADTCAREDPELVRLAAANFPNLTPAEHALLEFADKSNHSRGEFAVAGTSATPLDPSNDPAHADEWLHDRDVRAGLFRWLSLDNTAKQMIDPNRVRILGARITETLDLSYVHVPFALGLIRCSIEKPILLGSTEIPSIDLGGSYTAEISAPSLIVHGDLIFGDPAWDHPRGQFNASGVVLLATFKVDGAAVFGGGHFHYRKNPLVGWAEGLKPALYLGNADVKGDVAFCCGFECQGAAFAVESTIGGDFNCSGGRFINPGNVALAGGANTVKGDVFLSFHPIYLRGDFEANGLVLFENTRVDANFAVALAKFEGAAGEPHGFEAEGMSIGGQFTWRGVTLENGAIVDLRSARVGELLDDQKSWPEPGRLLIDGFTYGSFGGGLGKVYSGEGVESLFDSPSPGDVRSRLNWLALQPGFHPQPYRQLAQVLRENGDDAGALRVLIAAEDRHYSGYGFFGRIWGGFLKHTIGYGHRPMLTVMWSLAVMFLGWAMVSLAKAASVMRPTYPENTPPHDELHYQELHPLLYSLDVFLPFVNLHQEHYWWPDGDASGNCVLFRRSVSVRGSVVEYYLWAQIIAGWILSAIFVAGVTGLIRGD
jgi:hypothetical protein